MILTSEPQRDVQISERQEHSASGAKASLAARIIRFNWLPCVFALTVTIVWLSLYGVSLPTMGIFSAYLIVGITLPGLLIWRFVHRQSTSLILDIAAGTAVGYSLQVLTYIPGRAVGFPLLPQVIQLLVLISFVTIPPLRRYWRSMSTERVPILWSWALVGVWLVILLWSIRYVGVHGMHWPSYGAPDADMPFHLALIGEAKHHMPLMTPWVDDEPVLYHWFVYAQMASTSWATGIEPMVLLTRLSPLPMLAGFIVLIPLLTRRLTRNWWSGIVAIVGALYALSPHPYKWPMLRVFVEFGFSPYEDGSMFRLVLWTSPTQTFATFLFVPVVLILVDLLGDYSRDYRRWTLFILLAAAVMGAKATYLPLLLAALMLVTVVQLGVSRRLCRPALFAGFITLIYVIFAQLVLFGGNGAAQGLHIDPLAIIRASPATATVYSIVEPRWWQLILLTGVAVFCWLSIWGGSLALGRRIYDPPITLLLGLGLAGMGSVLVFSQSGGSQGFFLQSARPYLSVAAACGISILVPVLTKRIASILLGSVAIGLVIVLCVRVLTDAQIPYYVWGPKKVSFVLLWPYAALCIFLLLMGLVAWMFYRRAKAAMVLSIVISMAFGFSLFGAYPRLSMTLHEGHAGGWREVLRRDPLLTKGTMEAGRWLRDHSKPDDFIATNSHCSMSVEKDSSGKKICNGMDFALAAYSERRFLVEGWAFTATAHLEAAKHGLVANTPYWKPEVLADNDSAFKNPSADTVGKLRDKYGIRWLVVDETQENPSSSLKNWAIPRFRSGSILIYEVK